MTAPKITIYTKANCGHCARAKALLDGKKVAYAEISVEGVDDDVRTWLVEQTGELTVPQIFTNNQWLGGLSDLVALDGAGALDSILSGETIFV